MSWIKKGFVRDILIIGSISTLLLTIVNFVFVYNSPLFIKVLPSNVLRYMSPCYRTLLHYDKKPLERVNYVFGDSFSEGFGDEFLDGDDQYGIFNKLEDTGSSELIFGRSGYGNIGTLFEFDQCYPLLSTYTSLNTSEIVNYHVTFVFYEGNDLNNNLMEKGREANEIIYKVRFFFPLYEFVYKESRQFIGDIYRKIINTESSSSATITKSLPVSSSGIKLQVYPQSAATELTTTELEDSLTIASSILEEINSRLQESENFMVLYLPAVASSYSFDGEIQVQSYSGSAFFKTTGEFNLQRHQVILDTLRQAANKIGWYICDTTTDILAHTDRGIAVHGPRDWKHFNKIGYGIIANSYEECIRKMQEGS